MIEKKYDISFVADLARREKQIQQNYRPIIAVHKWFARRPGTLFRSLLLSEFADKPLQEAFYDANDLPNVHVADPFMGGGTPLIEANRIGCAVSGFDINPMAYWIVRQEIEHLDLSSYSLAAEQLRNFLEDTLGHLYRTRCTLCGSTQAHAKYFLWVKMIDCRVCGAGIDLFPGYLVAADARHPKNVIICGECQMLTEIDDRKNPGACSHCGKQLQLNGPAKRNRCTCSSCGSENSFPKAKAGPPDHRLFAIEYHCSKCKPNHTGRFFKSPDGEDIAKLAEIKAIWAAMTPQFVPNAEIPSGDETNRLHRWGYHKYEEMFNLRQLIGLETSARFIADVADDRVRNALATNLSDLLRYQNMLCRYDTRALKSLDIFSVHGFPVGLIQCESNLLGIQEPRKTVCIGSGGWSNIIEKYRKAKAYCDNPFEVMYLGKKKVVIPIEGEWIGDNPDPNSDRAARKIKIDCRDAASVELEDSSLDAVFTDPPYYGNVQYAELMDFCYVWLRRLVGQTDPAFEPESTRNPQELTGNLDMGRGLEHFTEGLSETFQRMAKALKPGSPLAFTYHHNQVEAYYPIAVAILDAGLTCSASIPCPAEMSASIHINGTESSIIDTVFVCRSKGSIPQKWVVQTPRELARLVEQDLRLLTSGNVTPSTGDVRCVIYGHLIRHAIWSLRAKWDKDEPVSTRITKIAQWLQQFGKWSEIAELVERSETGDLSDLPLFRLGEESEHYGDECAEISF